MDPDFHTHIDRLIAEGKRGEARELLEGAVRGIPEGWTPFHQEGRGWQAAFWHLGEFLAYTQWGSRPIDRPVIWMPGSYSRAWYQLGALAVEEGRMEEALFCLDCGLELEPDHPELWSEKGFVLGKMMRPGDSLECYQRAAAVREWATNTEIARALRGQGSALIDLGRLEEAQEALKKSLELEPESSVAVNELEYIVRMRSERGDRREPVQ